MEQPVITYDEISDSLTIAFAVGKRATGIELNDHILLRIDKDSRKAVGITIFDYSILSQQTEIGPRSVPLDGLNDLSDETREIVYEILLSFPVNRYLYVSAYTSGNMTNIVPITMIGALSQYERFAS